MRRCASMLVMVGASCGSDPGAARPAHPAATASTAPAPKPTAAPAPSVVVKHPSAPKGPAPLPAWLDPDYDERTAPLRARLVRNAELFGDEKNVALNEPTGAEMNRVVEVFEEPKAGSARVRVLCTSSQHRVALFLSRADLALVTRKGAVLAANETDLTGALTSPGSFPSVVFNGGVAIDLASDQTGEVVHVKYKKDAVSTEGVMARAQLDQVYEWPIEIDPIARNAKIEGAVKLYDAPKGKLFALLTTREVGGSTYDVQTVGPPRQGMVMARVRINDGIVTGWADEATVKPAPRTMVPRVRMGHASHAVTGGRRVTLPKGTLLTLGDEPIGVVTSERDFACTANCTERAPTVSVFACSVTISLTARLSPAPT